MTLGGLLVALSLLGACGEANGPTGIGTRAVVIGIDGADWCASFVYMPLFHG
jgi:hypothetical protein